jgi:hypothetical protein
LHHNGLENPQTPWGVTLPCRKVPESSFQWQAFQKNLELGHFEIAPYRFEPEIKPRGGIPLFVMGNSCFVGLAQFSASSRTAISYLSN